MEVGEDQTFFSFIFLCKHLSFVLKSENNECFPEITYLSFKTTNRVSKKDLCTSIYDLKRSTAKRFLEESKNPFCDRTNFCTDRSGSECSLSKKNSKWNLCNLTTLENSIPADENIFPNIPSISGKLFEFIECIR